MQQPKTPFNTAQQEDTDRDFLFTWRPADSVFVTLIKYKSSETAIYIHASDLHYSCSQIACLGHSCPTNTVLLGQAVLDNCLDEGCHKMHVLLFDALSIGDDDLVAMRMGPSERYSRLRELWKTPGKNIFIGLMSRCTPWTCHVIFH